MSFELKHAGGPKWTVVNENGEVVETFRGKRAEAERLFEDWLAGQSDADSVEDAADASGSEPAADEPVVETADEPKPEVKLPNPEGLSGLAKTAALNAQMETVVVEGEYRLKSGVHNEANHVYNVPDGWQAAWGTPRHIDGGRHANYLRERGYRPVYRDEMGTDMYGDELYVAYLDETDSDFVFMSGAQLFIGPSEKLARARKNEYDEHMAALNTKQEADREAAENLGGNLRTNRETSTYNPMRN